MKNKKIISLVIVALIGALVITALIINKTKVKVILDDNSQNPVYMYLSEGKYIEHQNDTFHNMFYIEEQKRGFDPVENHTVPGVYEVEIPAKTEKEISENTEKITFSTKNLSFRNNLIHNVHSNAQMVGVDLVYELLLNSYWKPKTMPFLIRSYKKDLKELNIKENKIATL